MNCTVFLDLVFSRPFDYAQGDIKVNSISSLVILSKAKNLYSNSTVTSVTLGVPIPQYAPSSNLY